MRWCRYTCTQIKIKHMYRSAFIVFDGTLNHSTTLHYKNKRSRRGRDRIMLDLQLPVQSANSKVVSSNPVHDEVYSIQHYMMKFVSDSRQVGSFLLVLRFPPPIKLTATV